MESSALAALRAYIARLPRCHYYTFRDTPGAARPHETVICRETGLWHHEGLFTCDAHGGEKNPWGRPLVEVRGAAELRVLMAFLATAQPDRGLLMVQADRAASDVLSASARRASVDGNPRATAADRERARRAEEAAEIRQMNADAALEAAGGRYNLCLIPLDHPSQQPSALEIAS